MIKIITDSGSDIPQEEAKRLNIKVIPLTMILNSHEYKDGVDFSLDEFYKLIKKNYPSTTQVNPLSYQEAFQEEIDKGNEILCMTISSKLSGCYQSAMIAKNNFSSVTVFDTNSVCIGQRNLVYLALSLIKEGKNMDEILSILEKKKKDVVLFASLDNLDHLVKGGRISPSAAIIGTILSIKPVIELIDGTIVVAGKARGYKNAHNMLVKMIEKYHGIDFSLPVSIAYSGNSRDMLDKYLESSKYIYEGKISQLPIYRIGSAIGSHAGEGAIAVSFFKKGD